MTSDDMKPVEWVGSSYKDFCSFPDAVQDVMGFALYQAQIGHIHRSAKPLKGFGGASVLEIIDDHQGDTYRAVYTVKFERAIYVLHAFQKKSKKGIKTQPEDMELIRRRLKAAEEDYKLNLRSRGTP
jgi:phage-related protein